MAASASQMASTINRIFDLFTTFSDGLTDKIMEENLKDVDLNVRAQALNALLQKRQLQIFKQGDFIVYKQQTKEESVRFKGLSSEDMLIYQAIKNAGNMGIWTKDMKRETNLQQPQVNKALKNLEARGLIKGVKCVSNQAKKVYMLAELTPSKEITGGAWYTGQNFDTEFTNIVKQQCLQFVLQQGVATIESVADFVRKSGISKVELKVEELKQMQQTEPTPLLCDNQGVMKLAKNPVFHERTKHVEVHCLFIRQLVEDGSIELQYCPTNDQTADILAKALGPEKYILDMLVLDGDVEEVISTGTGDFAAIPINKLCYRGSQARIQESSAFTNIPCGVCPVLRECTDDGLISPKTCIYYKKWLTF